MKKKVFIDGQEGTTGLQIRERLLGREDVALVEIPEDLRKDVAAKREAFEKADVVVLCLPDGAAVEAAQMGRELGARIIDASSAHRTDPGWVYGLPELTHGQREAVRNARFVSNPGCYPTGFLLAVRPLVDEGIISRDHRMTVHAISGYSGGGKKLIAAYKDRGAEEGWSVRPYGLSLSHKHVPEMRVFANLIEAPVFSPIVGNYYKGMIVLVPLHTSGLAKRVTPEAAHAVLQARYANERYVRVMPLGGAESLEEGYLSPTALNGTNDVELFVFGKPDQIMLAARLDNLGKGASGAAVQNLNLMLGLDEHAGL
jgi:N-acetyl-gamma-glutamyl-phosphate reductase